MSEPQQDSSPTSGWKSSHVYVLAVLCFLLGLPTGYLLHGGNPQPVAPTTQAAPTAEAPQGHGGSMNGGDKKGSLRRQAAFG